jgi:hypothetical protein
MRAQTELERLMRSSSVARHGWVRLSGSGARRVLGYRRGFRDIEDTRGGEG